jgi:hypothetical protein
MNRRDLLKMLAAAMAAPYVGPATGQEITPAKLGPGVATWNHYAGPLFRVSGFGDVGDNNRDAFRAWVEESPDAECRIVRMYNQAGSGTANERLSEHAPRSRNTPI